MTDQQELYKKYRPTKFSELIGQDDAVRMLVDMGKRKAIPHCLLLTGPSGVGKTTTARILKEKLNCSDSDFCEMNIADARGIDTVRSIRDRMGFSPMQGDCRIWLLDEVARATVDFQNSFLKMLEDTPSHVYFMLATTDPQKLLATIKTRATEVKFRLLKDKEMVQLLDRVADAEKFVMSNDVREKIVTVAEGSPRKALVLLNQIVGLRDEKEQLATLAVGVGSSQAIEIARLVVNPKTKWPAVAALLKVVEDEPEAVRRVLLGYCQAILLNGGPLSDRCFHIMDVLREPCVYDMGKPGLTMMLYEAVTK
jgi:DNA polymerase-3 subunit gamma/tau